MLSGWDISNDGAKIDPKHIDRMFVSLAPLGYKSDTHERFTHRVDSWVEFSDISCMGERSLLKIGDVLLPTHDLRMATAYDDCYNQSPERLLRSICSLGYRKDIVHYLGMSHYFRLHNEPADILSVDKQGTICTPCSNWHKDFLKKAAHLGYKVIFSLSYELFDEHCPESWKQRFFDGSPAKTGWFPPSTLLSPANDEAIEYLRKVAGNFVRLALEEAIDIAFQIGEPWWWQAPDRRISLYDIQAVEKFKNNLLFDPPLIADLSQELDWSQKALLDEAGHILGKSVLSIRDRVKEIGGDRIEVFILLFTPTILGEEMADAYRANVPTEWSWPQFDRLQLEDYDWLTEGADAPRRKAYTVMQDRLGYPEELQDYLSGFVLRSEDKVSFWKRIDKGIEEAKKRRVERCFVWALPQVARDGFTYLPTLGATEQMQAFDDVIYPLSLGRDSSVSPEFSTSIMVTASGHERRNSHWTDARLRFDVGPGIRSEEELGVLISFFRARRGAARGFRLTDPFDFSSNGMIGIPSATDQLLGHGDGFNATFQLQKRYGEDDAQTRFITRPRFESLIVSVGGKITERYSIASGGKLIFEDAPDEDEEVRAGFLFDVPVRFAEDRLDITGLAFAAGEAPSVPLIEIREQP